MIEETYKKAFTEVYTIFNAMPTELTDKIPDGFKRIIMEEKDNSYKFELKEPFEINNLMDESVVILGLVYRDFLCSKEKRIELQKQDRKELEELNKKIQEKYKYNDLFKKQNQKRKNTNNDVIYESKELVVIKDKWYQRIWKIVKGLFGRE